MQRIGIRAVEVVEQPPAALVARIERDYPHFSRQQATWLAYASTRPGVPPAAVLVLIVVCDAAGADLASCDLTHAQTTRRVNGLIRAARRGVDPATTLPGYRAAQAGRA